MTWETILRLRSSGARARDWFCMRGRLGEERAIVILGWLRAVRGHHIPRISSRGLTATRHAEESPPDDEPAEAGARARSKPPKLHSSPLASYSDGVTLYSPSRGTF